MKTLVLGASEKEDRYAYKAIDSLLKKGHEVVAIGQREGETLGIKIHGEPILFEQVDTVTLYLNPIRQRAYYDYIVKLHPNRVIFNPGTENPEFYELLKAKAINYEIACTLVLLATNQY